MSYDPNAPVLQNAHVFSCVNGSGGNSGPLAGDVRVLTLEVWKDSTASTGWLVTLQDRDFTHATGVDIAKVFAENVPTEGTLILDFQGAKLVNDCIAITLSSGMYAKVTYTID